MVAQICKASKLAFCITKRSRRPRVPESPLPTLDLNVFAQGLRSKYVLVLIELSTLSTPQSDSISK